MANSHSGLCDGTASSSNVCAGMSMSLTCLLQHTDSLGLLLGTRAPVMTPNGVDVLFLSTLVGRWSWSTRLCNDQTCYIHHRAFSCDIKSSIVLPACSASWSGSYGF